MSSPDSKWPSIKRLLVRDDIALDNCCAVSSGISILLPSSPLVIQTVLALRCPASTDDTNTFLVSFRPDHQHQALSYWTNRDEAIFDGRMLLIKELEILNARREEDAGFSKTDAAFADSRGLSRRPTRSAREESNPMGW